MVLCNTPEFGGGAGGRTMRGCSYLPLLRTAAAVSAAAAAAVPVLLVHRLLFAGEQAH